MYAAKVFTINLWVFHMVWTTVLSDNLFKKNYENNNQNVLTSVYDAMKTNGQDSIRRTLIKNDGLPDKPDKPDNRIKRNINDRSDSYYEDEYSNSHDNNWYSSHSNHNTGDLICTHPDQLRTQVTISDSKWNSVTYPLIKYGLLSLAILFLPFLLFKVFLLPLKLLFGLKTISLLNSVLLGTLLFRGRRRRLGAHGNNPLVSLSGGGSLGLGNSLLDEHNVGRILDMVDKKNENWTH